MLPEKFVTLWSRYLVEHKRDWRVGQAAFNALYDTFPLTANLIRGTAIDPFYNDSHLPAFLESIESREPTKY